MERQPVGGRALSGQASAPDPMSLLPKGFAVQAPDPAASLPKGYQVYPMAPTAPVPGQDGTYSNLPAQDVAPFQQGQAPAPGQGVAPPTVAPPQPAPPGQAPGPSLTITPDQQQAPPPGMVQASVAPPPSGGAPQAPAPLAPITPQPGAPPPTPLPEDGTPAEVPPLPGPQNPSTGEIAPAYKPYDHTPLQQAGDDLMTLLQGATGYAPEIKALVASAVPGAGPSDAPSFMQRYAQNLKVARAAYGAIPSGVRTVGEIAGGVAPFVAGAAAVDAVPALNSLAQIAPRVLGKVGGGIVNSGVGGGLIGGVIGSGEAGPDDRLGGALRGEAFGALTGGLASALGHVVGEGFTAAKNYLQPAFQRGEQPIINKATGLPVFDTNPDGSPKLDADGNGVPLTASPSVQRIAGQRLGKVPEAAFAPSQEGVPGSQFTVGQGSGDKTAIKMESQLEKNPATNPLFVQRREVQAGANQRALNANAGGGDVEHALNTFRAMRQAADDTAAQMRVPAVENDQAAAAAVGGGDRAAHGAALRAPALAHDAEQKAVFGRMNEAVDPTGTLAMDATPIIAARKGLMADIPSTATIPKAERKAYEVALRPSMTLKELNAYSSDLGALQDKLRIAGEQNPARRIGALKASIEDGITRSVERRLVAEAAEVQAGTRAPEDTISSRLEGASNELQSATSSGEGASDAGSLSGSGSVSRGQAAARSGNGREGGSLPARRGVADSGGRVSPILSASARSYPSLLSLLRRGGGVQDHGGELAAIFDNAKSARGLVRRNGGMNLDHAREFAEERGYLRPGSDINDLLDAIAKEHGGDKVYPEHVAAEREMQDGHDAQAVAQENWAAGAREAITMAAEDQDIRLLPDEAERATDFVIGGMHPDEAIHAAVTDTEAHEGDLAAARAQPAGMPGATQRDAFPLPEEGTPLASAEDLRAATEARRANNAFYSNFKRTQQNDAGKAIFARGPGGAFATSDAALPPKVLRPGAVGAKNLNDYLGQGGHAPAAMEALAEIAQQAVVRDGRVNLNALRKFRDDYGPSLAHPEMLPLRGRLDNAEDAAETFAQVNRQAAEHVRQFQASAVARFMGSQGHEDAARKVMELLKTSNATAVLRQLDQQIGNNEPVRQGIKQMLADGIAKASSSTRKEGASDINGMKPDAFKRLLRDRRQALSVFFRPNEMTNFDQLSKTLDMQARSGALKPPTESATGFNDELMKEFKSKGAPLVTLIKVLAAPAALSLAGRALDGGVGTLIGLGAGAVAAVLHSMHAAGMQGADELVAYGLLHPGVGNILRANAKPETVARLTRGLEVALARSTQQEMQRKGRRIIGAEPEIGYQGEVTYTPPP